MREHADWSATVSVCVKTFGRGSVELLIPLHSISEP
jgi:hypothetical protein